MSEWAYLIPQAAGSPWDKPGQVRYDADLDWPRLGIYCPHDPAPWLLGSFSVSQIVLERKSEVLWSWAPEFVTGDGRLIQLERQRAGRPVQEIVDDKPYDREALAARLTALPIGSPESTQVMEQMDYADATLRARIEMECKLCALPRTRRSDKVQPVVAALFSAGMREVSFDLFNKAADRSHA